MPGESETEIRIPVAPSVELGIVEINFLVSSQAGRANISHVVDVKVRIQNNFFSREVPF